MMPFMGAETSVQTRRNHVTGMSTNESPAYRIPAYKITDPGPSPRRGQNHFAPFAAPFPSAVFMAACVMLWSVAAVARAAPESFADLAEKLSPAVVNVSSTQMIEGGAGGVEPFQFPPGSPFEEFFREFRKRQKPGQPRKGMSLGSGFIIDPEGYIVTNNHVIAEAEEITVILQDNTELKAEIVGRDTKTDLALLKVEAKKKLPAIQWGDSDTARGGDWVMAIGNPFGQQFTMTTGIVSALGRTINSSNSAFSIPEVVQTDAPINPGNSGGPLLDRFGRVIAINTQIISRSGVSSGVGFAVPISIAKRVIPALIEDGHYDYSWLGITGSSLRSEIAVNMDLPKNTGGALISQVSGDSPADDAGLKGSGESFIIDGIEFPSGGDIIVAIDGETITRMADLIAYLVSNTQPGDKVVMEVIRSDEGRIELDVTLGKRPNTG